MESRLKSLCVVAGLPCEEDVTDLACFQVDEKLTILLVVEEETDLLCIECDLALILPEDRPEACRLIAVANYRFLQTDDSTLGIDPVTGTVSLCRRVPLGSLDETSFPVLITRFLDTAERWQGRLARLAPIRAAGGVSSPAVSGGDFGDFLNARA
jgi:hypothetical protein